MYETQQLLVAKVDFAIDVLFSNITIAVACNSAALHAIVHAASKRRAVFETKTDIHCYFACS